MFWSQVETSQHSTPDSHSPGPLESPALTQELTAAHETAVSENAQAAQDTLIYS